MAGLEITHITVREGAIDAEVRCALDVLHVPKGVAEVLQTVLPRLGEQVCVEGSGDKGPVRLFADEIVGTETPHLLEHVAIELMGLAYTQIKEETGAFPKDLELIGHTSWLEEYTFTAHKGYVLMQVTLTFANDLVCMTALKEAALLVNKVFSAANDTKSFYAQDSAKQAAEHALLRIKEQIRDGLSE